MSAQTPEGDLHLTASLNRSQHYTLFFFATAYPHCSPCLSSCSVLEARKPLPEVVNGVNLDAKISFKMGKLS